MTSRRVRGPAAHRAAGGEPPLARRGIQNSQRVRDAKHRAIPPSRTPRHAARRRDGDIAPYRNGTGPRDRAKPHGQGRGMPSRAPRHAARRRDGDIAPYRNGTAPRGTRGAHDAKPRTAVASRYGQGPGGASQEARRPSTSRPVATGPHHGAREVRTMPSRALRWRAATGNSAAARAGRPGGQASRPVATGPGHGTWQRDRTTERRNGSGPRD